MSTAGGTAGSRGSERGAGQDGRRDPSGERSAGESATAAPPGPAAASEAAGESPLLTELPDASAVALRLHGAGHPDATIAVALGIPVQAVPTTLGIAQAKLEALRREV